MSFEHEVGIHNNFQLTDKIKNVIKIEKGDITFGAINPSSNKIYLSYQSLNFILVVDINTKNILDKIPVNSPEQIQINHTTNMVYVIANGKVTIIDGSTNKITKELEEYSSFARFLSVDPLKNLLYVSYHNESDRSRKKDPINSVLSFDWSSHLKIGEINQGLDEPEGLVVDPQSNLIYVANSRINTISIIDGSKFERINDTIKIPYLKDHWYDIGGSSWQRLDNIAMFNNNKKLLYIVGAIGASGGAEEVNILTSS